MKKNGAKYSEIEEEIVPMVRETEVPYLIERVRRGLAIGEFHALQDQLGVNEEWLAALLGMSRATLRRRKKSGHMDRAESDRLVRYARLFARATEALGGHANARSWLVEPARAFDGECPLDYADTEIARARLRPCWAAWNTEFFPEIVANYYRIVQAAWASLGLEVSELFAQTAKQGAGKKSGA